MAPNTPYLLPKLYRPRAFGGKGAEGMKRGIPTKLLPFWHQTAGLIAAAVLALVGATSLRASQLTVEFKSPDDQPSNYEEASVYILDQADSSIKYAEFSTREKAFTTTFKDLDPGNYMVVVFTGNWDDLLDPFRPGAFRALYRVTVEAGSPLQTITAEYEHFEPSDFLGDAASKGRLTNLEGDPIGGFELQAIAYQRFVGPFPVATATTDGDGTFEFVGLLENHEYRIAGLNQNENLGTGVGGQPIELRFRFSPEVGQPAPDVRFYRLADGGQERLSDFSGKVIVLEFWATWCGACQRSMREMQTYLNDNPHWGDDVALVSISLDRTKEMPVRHLTERGWDSTHNVWAGPAAFRSEAAKSFVVQAVPTVYVIGPDGKVAHNGHPGDLDIPSIIDELISR